MEMTIVNFVPQTEGGTIAPLGPLYIASVLEQEGWHVDFRDYQCDSYATPLDLKNITRFLSGSDPVLGIGCFYNALPFLLLSLERMKEAEKITILGGPGPTSVAESIMKQFSCVNLIVKGEGEHAVRDLARTKPYKDISGIVYRSRGHINSTPEGDRIRPLDSIPFPAYDEVDISRYDHVGVTTARGCSSHCTFCDVPALWGYLTERRSVSNVVAEIEMLSSDYGVDTVYIIDETFLLDRKWITDFCRRIENTDVAWRCRGRIIAVDEELLSTMRDAGCISIQYDIESGSERVLRRIKTQTPVQHIEEIIDLSTQYIDTVYSIFLWGFPFETMEDFYATLTMMRQVEAASSQTKLLLLSPAPLSPLYREYRHQLKFSEELVSDVLWAGAEDKILQEERELVLKTIRENPDVFSGFYYFHTPDVKKKYLFLKDNGLLD